MGKESRQDARLTEGAATAQVQTSQVRAARRLQGKLVALQRQLLSARLHVTFHLDCEGLRKTEALLDEALKETVRRGSSFDPRLPSVFLLKELLLAFVPPVAFSRATLTTSMRLSKPVSNLICLPVSWLARQVTMLHLALLVSNSHCGFAMNHQKPDLVLPSRTWFLLTADDFSLRKQSHAPISANEPSNIWGDCEIVPVEKQHKRDV